MVGQLICAGPILSGSGSDKRRETSLSCVRFVDLALSRKHRPRLHGNMATVRMRALVPLVLALSLSACGGGSLCLGTGLIVGHSQAARRGHRRRRSSAPIA